MQTTGGSGVTRFDPDKAEQTYDTCKKIFDDIDPQRETIATYYEALLELWVGDASTAHRELMFKAIRELDEVYKSYWDVLALFDLDREELKNADKVAKNIADNIEQAVWADIDTGIA